MSHNFPSHNFPQGSNYHSKSPPVVQAKLYQVGYIMSLHTCIEYRFVKMWELLILSASVQISDCSDCIITNEGLIVNKTDSVAPLCLTFYSCDQPAVQISFVCTWKRIDTFASGMTDGQFHHPACCIRNTIQSSNLVQLDVLLGMLTKFCVQ